MPAPPDVYTWSVFRNTLSGMSQATTASMTAGAEGFLRRHHFLLRRLHSLSGIVPIGVFLIVHLYTNSLALLGAEQFNEHVRTLHHTPYLMLVEIFAIFAPLAFHAGYGVVIAKTARVNVGDYGYADNWRYTLQRVSGWVALLFILVHLGHYRFAHWFGGLPYMETVASGRQSPFELTATGFDIWNASIFWIGAYVVGLVASIYHFCNGIVTFCITWGITVGDKSRRGVSIAAAGLALVLLGFGFSSLIALNR